MNNSYISKRRRRSGRAIVSVSIEGDGKQNYSLRSLNDFWGKIIYFSIFVWERESRKEREKGINRHRPLMSSADSPIQKETTESFLATVEAVLIVLPYCTELLSKMLCLPLFIQAKVCVCVCACMRACVGVRCRWEEDKKRVCVVGEDRQCAYVHVY